MLNNKGRSQKCIEPLALESGTVDWEEAKQIIGIFVVVVCFCTVRLLRSVLLSKIKHMREF